MWVYKLYIVKLKKKQSEITFFYSFSNNIRNNKEAIHIVRIFISKSGIKRNFLVSCAYYWRLICADFSSFTRICHFYCVQIPNSAHLYLTPAYKAICYHINSIGRYIPEYGLLNEEKSEVINSVHFVYFKFREKHFVAVIPKPLPSWFMTVVKPIWSADKGHNWEEL